jgi:peroxiredoxin
MNLRTRLFYFITIISAAFAPVFAGDAAEYQGQFDKALVANVEDFERVIFKFSSNDQISRLKIFKETTHTATGRLYNPQTGKFSVLASVVESEDDDEKPILLVDLNGDNAFDESEQIAFTQSPNDNRYLWNVTVNLPVKESFFTTCALFVRYFQHVKTEKMTDDDRLLTQSTEVLARGKVDVKGKKVVVQYAYDFSDKKVSAQNTWLGVDIDDDGEIDMNTLSPEAAKSGEKDTIVFRAGQTYLSTKKVDIGKNSIVMREHEAKDYKRAELWIGKDFPDFEFVDFNDKKRKFSEFRGKYVLLDVWGLWCPPCRKELPFIRESYKRFQGRNLEVLGLNTDERFTPDAIRTAMNENGMKWTQAQFESVFELIAVKLRITSFPSTFLISPTGKILSMSRSSRDEPDLRGEDLIETLDKILPAK